jgi:methylated-DNA-[protein]-cysteine S-methyltransferase
LLIVSAAEQTPAYRFATAIGVCALRYGQAGVSEVLMPGTRLPPAAQDAHGAGSPQAVRDAAAAIVSLLDGERTDLRWIVLDAGELEGFRREVYEATRQVPAGETVSYGEIAAAIGRPGTAREVGAALARNPFPIVVPCHRVLSSTGALHGFSAPGGLATKRRMLEIEGAPGFIQQALFA